MKRLSEETIVTLHGELISQTGGLYGVHDTNLLDAAINSPFHTFDGRYLYLTMVKKKTRSNFLCPRKNTSVLRFSVLILLRDRNPPQWSQCRFLARR